MLQYDVSSKQISNKNSHSEQTNDKMSAGMLNSEKDTEYCVIPPTRTQGKDEKVLLCCVVLAGEKQTWNMAASRVVQT